MLVLVGRAVVLVVLVVVVVVVVGCGVVLVVVVVVVVVVGVPVVLVLVLVGCAVVVVVVRFSQNPENMILRRGLQGLPIRSDVQMQSLPVQYMLVMPYIARVQSGGFAQTH